MASGSFNGTFSGTEASNVYPRIEWNSSSSVANNTSSVTVVLYFVRASSYWKSYNLNGHNVSININGNSVMANRKFDLRKSSKYEVWRRTVTVAHNSDGKKSITIRASTDGSGTGISLGSYNFSGTATLDNIPRASTMAWVSADSPHTFGKTQHFTVTSASASFYHAVEMRINGVLTDTPVMDSQGGGTKSLVIPRERMTSFTNKPQATGISFRLITYKTKGSWAGASMIGYHDYSLPTCDFPADVVPTTSAVAITDGNAKAQALLGDGTNFVQGVSSLNISITAAGVSGSTITSSETVVNGKTYASTTNSGRSVTINLAGLSGLVGTQAIKIRTKDSRGRWSGYLTKSITVWAYTTPHINAAVERINNTTQLKFTKSATVSSIKIGTTEKNTYTATTDYKLSSDTAWTNAKTESNVFASVTIDGFAIDKSYDIRLTITDKFTSTSTTTTISTAKVLLDFYRDTGVGIGKMYEDGNGVLDIGGSVVVDNGQLLITDTNTTGTLTAETLAQMNAVGSLLWSGTALMTSDQTITPALPLSKCLNGWVFVWTRYSNGTSNNSQYVYHYVPKSHAKDHSGAGISMTFNSDAKAAIFKYIYVTDTTAKGYAANSNSPNNGYALIEVHTW